MSHKVNCVFPFIFPSENKTGQIYGERYKMWWIFSYCYCFLFYIRWLYILRNVMKILYVRGSQKSWITQRIQLEIVTESKFYTN